jgi:hypothetical protein
LKLRSKTIPLIMNPARTAARVPFAGADATADQLVREQPTFITPACKLQ